MSSYLGVFKPFEDGGATHSRMQIINENARTFRDLTFFNGLLLVNSNGYPLNQRGPV